jgi:hypothetical protein
MYKTLTQERVMNLSTELEYAINKVREVEALFKDKVPSVSGVIDDSQSLMTSLNEQKSLMEEPMLESVKSAVDTAWIANARELSSKDVSESDKISLLSKFYFKNVGLSTDEISELITYSNRIVKSNVLMAQATGLRIKMINEVSGILGNLAEFSQQDAENGICTIQINHDKLFDVPPADKVLLKTLERLILDQHDSRSSSFIKPEDRARDEMIDEVRGDLSGASRLLQRFEKIMYFNKQATEHTILNNLYMLENIIKEYHSVYELGKQKSTTTEKAPSKELESLKTDKYFGLSDNGELLYLGKHDDMDGAEDKASEMGEEIIFFVGADVAEDWRNQLPGMADRNKSVGITDSLLLFGLGNPETMEEADMEFQRGLDRHPNDNYAWISDLDGKQMKQWQKTLGVYLHTKVQKSIKGYVAKGTGDYDQDGGYGPIIDDSLESESIADVVDFLQDFVFYHDLSKETYIAGDIKVDGEDFTSIDWEILKFKENFKAVEANRLSKTGNDLVAMDHLSGLFNYNNITSQKELPDNQMEVAKMIYIACYDDKECLEKLSTVFHNGVKGINVNEAIAFDLTMLSEYAGQASSKNASRKKKKKGNISSELKSVLEALGHLDDFNSWQEDKGNIEVKSVNDTAKTIVSPPGK